MTRFILSLLIAFPLLANANPQESIETFQQALMEFALGNTSDFEKRYEKLAPVVEATHDLDYIARLTLGQHWTDLSAEQRQTFVSRFRRLAIANYAARFPKFSGEQFQVIEQKPQRRNIVLVRTELQRPNADPLGFDYLLHETPDGWRIVNILVNGVSDLALKRAEYSAALRDGTLGDLLQTLDEQFERLRSGPQ